MSTERGSDRRKRSSKYKNETAFKNNKYDSNTKAKQLGQMRIANVCQKCKGVIEWKIKYNKYKPLSTPSKCVRCSQKTVKYAYHVACTSCVVKERVCAKCLEVKEILEAPEPDNTQRQREETQLKEGLKGMSLRERTTFLRQIERDRVAAESGAKKGAASGIPDDEECDEMSGDEISDEDYSDSDDDSDDDERRKTAKGAMTNGDKR